MSIFQRDFLRRLIEDFARMLASLVALRRGGKLDEAEQQIAELAGSLLGPLARDAELLDSETLGRLLAEERLVRYAQLIAERANIHVAKGNAEAAKEDQVRALELFLEVKARHPEGDAAALPPEASELLALLGLPALSARYVSLARGLRGN